MSHMSLYRVLFQVQVLLLQDFFIEVPLVSSLCLPLVGRSRLRNPRREACGPRFRVGLTTQQPLATCPTAAAEGRCRGVPQVA